MTSSPENNEKAKMAGSTSNGRSNKFNAMTNGAEASEQARGNVFPITNGTKSTVQNNGFAILQNSGIWGNGGNGWNKNRSTLGSSRDTGDKFTTAPSGSGALAASSEAELPYQPSWPSQTRNTSGNTSPNRPRIDPPSQDMQINSSFYQPPNSQPAIGQRASGRTNAGAALDNPQGPFNKFGQLPENPDNGRSYPPRRLDGSEPRRNDFTVPSQLSRDGQFPQMSGRPSQGVTMLATHPESDIGKSFIDAQYAGYGSNHSQRQSFSGQSSAFMVQPRGLTNGAGQHMEEAELHSQMNNLTLDVANGTPSLHGFSSAQSSFQFNPGSQPWENPQGLGQAYFHDGYTNGINGIHDRRGSGVGRASPAGSAYRSPRSFVGTPQPGPEGWGSRPASRDHRIPLDSERRGLIPSYPPPSQYPSAGYINNYPQYGGFDNFQQVQPRVGYQGFQPHNLTARPSRDHDPIAQASSPLLQEFRNNQKSGKDRERRWELKDIYGHVVEFSGDQHGSRFIQQKLESANSDEKAQLFSEICPNAVALMKDVFGNYVIQKLFEHGSQVEKKILADRMKGQVISLSLQMYSCRVVQKALEHILIQQQAELVKELEPDIVNVLMDQNGNHVVQKIIELVPREDIGFIMDCFRGKVGELGLHTYACRVIQRALEHGNEDDKRAILAEIHAHIRSLVSDQYGNYVAQHVIGRGIPEDRSRIIAFVTSDLLKLSKHKFASNVVEKCIEHGTPEERRRIAEQLCGQPDGDDSNLQGMMKDQFGNYVIQKLLKTLQGHELETLKEAVKPQVLALKKPGVNPGKHVNVLESLVISDSSASPGSPAPASPGLQGNGGSTVPTPNLTTEPNSPSSNPPSTNASSVGEVEHHANGKLTGSHINGAVVFTEVQDDDVC